jgi:hypothetical protein
VQLPGHGLEKIPERLTRANQHKTDGDVLIQLIL